MSSRKVLKYQKGMTLVELLVVLSIFAVVSMTVAFNYNSYKSNTSTNVSAQNVALSIREAQGYAMGVKSVVISDRGIFPGYGVHYSLTESSRISGGPKSFVLFADIPANINNPSDKGDSVYNYPAGSGSDETACNSSTIDYGNESVSVTELSGGDIISGVCANEECDSDSYNTAGSLDIVFHRPNPDASFCYKQNVNDAGCVQNVSYAGVMVRSPSDSNINKKIIVWNTGQISVK